MCCGKKKSSRKTSKRKNGKSGLKTSSGKENLPLQGDKK